MKTTLIELLDAEDRQHRATLQSLLRQTEGTVRIASAYVTDTSLLSGTRGRDVRLLTHISKADIIFGATSLQSLLELIKKGVQCRYHSEEPRLHAKVYLFGSQHAVVTSANLTQNAFNKNIEVGVCLDGTGVTDLVVWFDALWDEAEVLNSEVLASWKNETEAERLELLALRKKVEKQPQLSSSRSAALRKQLNSGSSLFVCNTNRKYSTVDEKNMRMRGYAAAWETFHFPSHMDRVKRGDTICMYAKGIGIVGIGRARGKVEKLEPGVNGRVALQGQREWRVPVDWLVWNEDSPFEWKSPNSTFFEISEDRSFRDDIQKHFKMFL